MQARTYLGIVATVGALGGAAVAPPSPGLVLHEWGTFTTVAGKDGLATDWLPLGGPDDLPCFVEHADDRAIGRIKGLTGASLAALPDYATARTHLIGKVRMETPVLYFYSPSDISADVRVDFPRGLMTEWYPSANNSQRTMTTESLRAAGGTTSLKWDNVRITNQAARFPQGDEPSHYYAARATDAAPVRVGAQSEKFLFYRGVANFDVPISAVALNNDAVRVTNTGKTPLPVVIAFSNRGGKLGFVVQRNVTGSVTMSIASSGVTLPDLRRELEALLAGEGLFAKEAAAMVETWRDTWFEEGTRVLYVFPQSVVDQVLPLSINPAPARTTRVFVGRMDVVTPSMQETVARALQTGDSSVLASYGRILGPIADRILAETSDGATRTRIHNILNATLTAQLQARTICP